jgi:hypothetical protein
MSGFADRWQRFVAFTEERESPRVLAIFRILISTLLAWTCIDGLRTGVFEVMWVSRPHGGAVTTGAPTLVRWLGGATPEVVQGLAVATIAACVATATGRMGRWSSLIAAQTYFALVQINPDTVGGYDALMINGHWILFLSGAHRDLALAVVQPPENLVTSWPRRLLVFQILLVYGFTGLQKVSPVWLPMGSYSALYWVFQDPTWRRFDMDWTAPYSPILAVMTAITWHWEVFAPLLLLWYWARRRVARAGDGASRFLRVIARRDWRKPFLLVGVGLHVGILLTLDVGPFSLVSMAYYVCFLTPEDVAQLRRRFAGSPRESPQEEPALSSPRAGPPES